MTSLALTPVSGDPIQLVPVNTSMCHGGRTWGVELATQLQWRKGVIWSWRKICLYGAPTSLAWGIINLP